MSTLPLAIGANKQKIDLLFFDIRVKNQTRVLMVDKVRIRAIYELPLPMVVDEISVT
jgi:hypothetical protein